jgi:hypothetical protein
MVRHIATAKGWAIGNVTYVRLQPHFVLHEFIHVSVTKNITLKKISHKICYSQDDELSYFFQLLI